MKKQKAKKGKKKEEKTEAPAEAEASTTTEKAEEKPEEAAPEAAPEPEEAESAPPAEAEDDDKPSELLTAKASHGRKPSVAVESRQRSESFYRSGAAGTPTSPGGLTPSGGITSEVYKEQAHKIEELEKENKRLAEEREELESKWKKGEEELEELRESRGDAALAVEKGKDADKLVSLRMSLMLCGLMANFILESRGGIAQEAIIAGSISEPQIQPKNVDRIAQSICIHRRSECSSGLEVCHNRIIGA